MGLLLKTKSTDSHHQTDKKTGIIKCTAFSLAMVMTLAACGSAGPDASTNQTTEESTAAEEAAEPAVAAESSLKTDDYTLKQVVVLSRHNIRSPLSGSGSVLGDATPHEWFQWTSEPSELSQRGGVLETEMGQYFRKWLAKEGLFEENAIPQNDVRFYANAKQRTIATANYFASAMFPAANIDIETHAEYDKMDDVFNPQLTFFSDSYREAAENEMKSIEAEQELADNYEILDRVVDIEESKAYKDGTVSDLKEGDTEFVLEDKVEPGMKGSLKTATSLSDALVLQYYEEADEKEAAFGEDLTEDDWKAIAEIKDIYQNELFTTPLIAVNVAHPLLVEIDKEMENKDRKFTFLCGHDSNIGSVLAALDAKEYELPGALEQTIPIGAKLVFEKWENRDGKEFVGVELIYQNTEDLKNISMLSMENPPAIVTMTFDGLKPNDDGLYPEEDFAAHLHGAISAYDEIQNEYK